MKRVCSLVVLFILAIPLGVFGSTEIKWFPLKEGMDKARAEKKIMIVDFFFGKGCPRCEVLQKTVYENPPIAKKVMEDFVPIRIDLTKKLSPEEEKLGMQYDYKNDCLLLFLDQEGNVIKDPGGKRLCFVDVVQPEWFVKYLDYIKATYYPK